MLRVKLLPRNLYAYREIAKPQATAHLNADSRERAAEEDKQKDCVDDGECGQVDAAGQSTQVGGGEDEKREDVADTADDADERQKVEVKHVDHAQYVSVVARLIRVAAVRSLRSRRR